MRGAHQHQPKLLVCLAIVYLVWGSSFLVSKIGVTHLPPLLFCGLRFVTAASILALVGRFWSGDAWPRGWTAWRHGIVMGLLMVFAGNGLNAWSVRTIPSNQVALLNGTTALWIAGLGVFGRRGIPLDSRAIVGLVIGFIGTALTLVPKGPLVGSHLLAQAGALGACLAWALGTLYYRSIETDVSPLMFTAMQLLCGGMLFCALGVANGDVAAWTASLPGLIALAYLTLFSSCLAFTAYGWLTLHAAPALIGTYCYVNPAIAAVLGWEFLHEELAPTQVAGMMVILVGVAILTLPGNPRRALRLSAAGR
jgi:drug/metabolite transporter (DMT)-like permease